MEVAIFGFSEIKDKIKVPTGLNLEFNPSSRWIYDFDVVIGKPTDIMDKRWGLDNVIDLIKSNGLIICFINTEGIIAAPRLLDSIKLMEGGNADLARDAWTQFLYQEKYFSLSYSRGKTVRPTPSAGILSNIITKIDWHDYYFKKYTNDSLVIAVDKADHAVALRIPVFNSEIIVLPMANESSNLVTIISSLLEALPKLKRFPEEEMPPPEWVTSYTFPEEEKLLTQKREIEERLRAFQARKELLYARGDRLEEAVRLALEQFGFTVEKLPKGSYADFALKLDDKEVAGVEVKGSVKQIDLEDFRQLLHYLIDCKADKKPVKGILVGNHFCEKPPNERGGPFTEDALDAAKRHDVSLATTVELFKALQKLDEQKITPEEVRNKILSASGLCSIVENNQKAV
jgi:hypothetical protein